VWRLLFQIPRPRQDWIVWRISPEPNILGKGGTCLENTTRIRRPRESGQSFGDYLQGPTSSGDAGFVWRIHQSQTSSGVLSIVWRLAPGADVLGRDQIVWRIPSEPNVLGSPVSRVATTSGADVPGSPVNRLATIVQGSNSVSLPSTILGDHRGGGVLAIAVRDGPLGRYVGRVDRCLHLGSAMDQGQPGSRLELWHVWEPSRPVLSWRQASSSSSGSISDWLVP